MGQYFVAVNETKKEYVCPWCIGGLAKLLEWAFSRQCGIFVLLLRRSSGSGGGDYLGPTTQILDPSKMSHDEIRETLARSVLREGAPCGIPRDSVVGSWAGDQVYLVGDYDSSGLYDFAFNEYRNISREVVEAYNQMDPDLQLKFNDKCCQKGKQT